MRFNYYILFPEGNEIVCGYDSLEQATKAFLDIADDMRHRYIVVESKGIRES